MDFVCPQHGGVSFGASPKMVGVHVGVPFNDPKKGILKKDTPQRRWGFEEPQLIWPPGSLRNSIA